MAPLSAFAITVILGETTDGGLKICLNFFLITLIQLPNSPSVSPRHLHLYVLPPILSLKFASSLCPFLLEKHFFPEWAHAP